MKNVFEAIADRIELRVGEYRDSYPRTQATDAMVGLGTDIVGIIRESIKDLDDTATLSSEDVKTIINEQLTELTAPTKKAGKK